MQEEKDVRAEVFQRELEANHRALARTIFGAERLIHELQPIYAIYWHAIQLGALGETILRLTVAGRKEPIGGKSVAQILLRLLLRPQTPGQRLLCDEWASFLELALHDGTPPSEFVSEHKTETLRECLKYVRNFRSWGVLKTELPTTGDDQAGQPL